jgi:hypothetical protein
VDFGNLGDVRHLGAFGGDVGRFGCAAAVAALLLLGVHGRGGMSLSSFPPPSLATTDRAGGEVNLLLLLPVETTFDTRLVFIFAFFVLPLTFGAAL